MQQTSSKGFSAIVVIIITAVVVVVMGGAYYYFSNRDIPVADIDAPGLISSKIIGCNFLNQTEVSSVLPQGYTLMNSEFNKTNSCIYTIGSVVGSTVKMVSVLVSDLDDGAIKDRIESDCGISGGINGDSRRTEIGSSQACFNSLYSKGNNNLIFSSQHYLLEIISSALSDSELSAFGNLLINKLK